MGDYGSNAMEKELFGDPAYYGKPIKEIEVKNFCFCFTFFDKHDKFF